MSSKLHKGRRKVYLAVLSKGDKPYIKVGITSFSDAMDRFMFEDRGGSLNGIFDKVKIHRSVVVPDEQSAKELERRILLAWGPKDFMAPMNFSGITEIRRYTPQRYAIACTCFERAKK